MKVILLQDVAKVGKKGEVKEVSDGYGRNYLIARGLAVFDSPAAKKVLEKQKLQQDELNEQKRLDALDLKDKLAQITLQFPVKCKGDRVSGSISTKQIEQGLKKQGIAIDKRKIIDCPPLNALGTTIVKIELYKGVIGQIKVRLVEA